jgi:hypothetical protein
MGVQDHSAPETAPWVPLGYMLKRVTPAPAWLAAPAVRDICALSGCISEPFADFIGHWRHNGHGLFDSAAGVCELARSVGAEFAQLTLFYYEAWPQEYHEGSDSWEPLRAPAMPVNVEPPAAAQRLGYDVASWSTGSGAECSPLSCNRLAAEIEVNTHCLLDRAEDARELLSQGRFANSEPGPFRVVAVHRVAG